MVFKKKFHAKGQRSKARTQSAAQFFFAFLLCSFAPLRDRTSVNYWPPGKYTS